MLERLRMFPFFILDALKQGYSPRLPSKSTFLLKDILVFLNHSRLNLKTQIPLLCFVVFGVILTTLLTYRVKNLKTQLFQQEEQIQAFQKRLFEKKKELSLLNHLQQERAYRVFEQMLNVANLSRINLANRLKALAQEIGFQDMSFSLSPQEKTLLNGQLPIRFTTVSVSYRVQSDVQLWKWINRLYLEFPCFFVPKRLSIVRVVDHQGNLQSLSGTYMMDWIVFDGLPCAP